MSFKGVDIRSSGDRVIVRASLKDSAGAKVTTGTATLYLYELQSDGSYKSYDFNSNTFKTTALTTETANLTHRTGNNGTTNIGVWTYALTTVSGFTRGNVYLAVVSHASASPPQQEREFQYGEGEGDLAVDASGQVTVGTNNDKTGYALDASQSFNNTGQAQPLPADAQKWGGSSVTGNYTADFTDVAAAVAAVKAKTDSLTFTVAGKVDASGNWLTTLGANAPANWINAAAVAASALDGKGDWATAGDAMALTPAERDATAVVVESHLLDEGDSQMLINAIVGAIGNTNVDQAAFVAAVRADLERAGGTLKLIDAKTTNLPASPAATGDVQAGLTAQGYTAARAANLDHLDADVTSRMATFTLPANFALMLIDADGRPVVDAHKVHWTISGTTQSVYRADNATVSYTKTLTTDAAAEPVTGN